MGWAPPRWARCGLPGHSRGQTAHSSQSEVTLRRARLPTALPTFFPKDQPVHSGFALNNWEEATLAPSRRVCWLRDAWLHVALACEAGVRGCTTERPEQEQSWGSPASRLPGPHTCAPSPPDPRLISTCVSPAPPCSSQGVLHLHLQEKTWCLKALQEHFFVL